MSTRARPVCVALALAILAAGCGVPTSGGVRTLPSSKVPPGLLDATPSARPLVRTTAPDEVLPGASNVFFVVDGRLVGTAVPQAGGDPRIAVQRVVALLSGGPTSSQRSAGLGTAVPAALSLAVTGYDGAVVTIDLTGEDTAAVGDEGPLATGQLVLTATSVPGVDGVRLTRSGQPVDAPLVGGALTSRPLSSRDYLTLLG